MPNCLNCTQPCACSIVRDGTRWEDFAFATLAGDATSLAAINLRGQPTTHVTGTGSASDPYIISIIDAEGYKPTAGERDFPAFVVATGGGSVTTTPGNNGVVIYESPETTFLTGTFSFATVAGTYFLVGAVVEWAGNATGDRVLTIRSGAASPTGDTEFARQVCSANAGTQRMSCSGFATRVPSPIAPLESAEYQRFTVTVAQSSGGNLSATLVKFWIVELR